MAKFTDYTEKTEPVDTDLALIYDTQAKVNKKFTFGNLWKWIAKKIVSEGISQLDTTNKTIPGAINELNSKFDRTIITKDDLISNLHTYITIVQYDCSIRNNVVDIYLQIKVANTLSGSGSAGLSIMKYAYAPATEYKICTFTTASVPYTPLTSGASYWIASSGVVMLYGTLPVGNYYMTSEYVVR